MLSKASVAMALDVALLRLAGAPESLARCRAEAVTSGDASRRWAAQPPAPARLIDEQERRPSLAHDMPGLEDEFRSRHGYPPEQAHAPPSVRSWRANASAGDPSRDVGAVLDPDHYDS
jgi:hypothetical protein